MDRPQREAVNIRRELTRLARFGANIVDAHSCFVLVPASIFDQFAESLRLGAPGVQQSYRSDVLELSGCHSLSNDILPGAVIPRETGLIGWVAKHNRPIHVSPFEHDSRTLGVYSRDQQLKSFLGIPVPFRGQNQGEPTQTGVIACDSKKAFAFSKLQGKLLEEFALEVAEFVFLCLSQHQGKESESTWKSFLSRAEQLAEALSMNSIEVLRIRIQNLSDIETQLGTSLAIERYEQVVRLIQQALPPHFPLTRLPSGDLILVLDNMMTSFYEAKIAAICKHVSSGPSEVTVEYQRASWKEKSCRGLGMQELIAMSNQKSTAIELQRGMVYEHRRA